MIYLLFGWTCWLLKGHDYRRKVEFRQGDETRSGWVETFDQCWRCGVRDE